MSREEFERRLRRAAPFAALGAAQAEALWRHYELMARWNARINLTRVVELEAAVRNHYAESLFVAGQIPAGARTVLDVGSGAGFPGFVVAVARPELRVTLLESDQRKAAFLREASDFAPNVQVLGKRSREVEGQFDVVVSRAVRAEDVLEVAERVGRWAMLVGAALQNAEGWEAVELPGGRGQLWIREIRGAGTGEAADSGSER